MKVTFVLIVVTALAAVIIADRKAAAEQSEDYPVLAYASPPEQSMVSLHAKAARRPYVTEEGLFSGPTSSAGTEGGIIVEWRDRVFLSLASNLTPEAANGDRIVARIAVRESMKLAMERYPVIGRLISAVKFEVSTDTLAGDEERDGNEEAPAFGPPQARHQAAKERFLMRTGLRVPLENGRPMLLSETAAVYGGIITFMSLKLNGNHDSRLGFRYKMNRETHVQVERTTTDVADPAAGGPARRSASNMVTVVWAF